MGKRRFEITFIMNGEFLDTGIIELDDQVIEVVDDNWREHLYNLNTPEEIADHIAYNIVVNHWSLSKLDGWADQPDGNARMIKYPNLLDELELTTFEIPGEK